MQNFGNNLPLNFLPALQNIGSKVKTTLNKLTQKQEKAPILDTKNTPNKSLVNTNSNININQQTQTSPVVTQGSLNATSLPISKPLNETNSNNSNTKSEQVPIQSSFQGPKDLPAYAGITQIYMKQGTDKEISFTKLEGDKNDLRSTMQGITGFQKRNFEGNSGEGGSGGKNQSNRMLILLSQIFGIDNSLDFNESALLNNLSNFKQLGDSDNSYLDFFNETSLIAKAVPPDPIETQEQAEISLDEIKHFSKLLLLPDTFPECLRLFSKNSLEIDSNYFKNFLEKRLKILQEQLFSKENSDLNKLVKSFSSFTNTSHFSLLLPLVLLYYPLPLPYVKETGDFKIKKREGKTNEQEDLLASCDIYYFAKQIGRFLIKFKLDKKNNFTFNIETNETNKDIVFDLEQAISEAMLLLKSPPNLAELNSLLTNEIYEATDTNEELAITSYGPIRVEIVLATYSVLVVLNKINKEIEENITFIDLIE